MNNPFNFFNLSDFKKWMNKHSEEESKNNSFVGKHIKARSNVENLEEKVQIEFGDDEDVIKEFLESGGKITEQDGNKFMIEVSCGSFICHRRFLKKIS